MSWKKRLPSGSVFFRGIKICRFVENLKINTDSDDHTCKSTIRETRDPLGKQNSRERDRRMREECSQPGEDARPELYS